MYNNAPIDELIPQMQETIHNKIKDYGDLHGSLRQLASDTVAKQLWPNPAIRGAQVGRIHAVMDVIDSLNEQLVHLSTRLSL